MKNLKKKHLGSKFDDFLEEHDMLEECRASAIKFKIAHELEKAMSERKITKADMAKRLKTSRTGIDRLLDPDNTSITLNTMAKVAHLLGKRIDFALR
jgi:antitoxin HicB